MGLLRDKIDKLLNPLKYETPLERDERHRREQRQHELDLAAIRHGSKNAGERKRKTLSSSEDMLDKEMEFFDNWGNKKRTK